LSEWCCQESPCVCCSNIFTFTVSPALSPLCTFKFCLYLSIWWLMRTKFLYTRYCMKLSTQRRHCHQYWVCLCLSL
jgi:hypothetical protein